MACGFQDRSRFVFSSVKIATVVKAILKMLNRTAEFFGVCIYVIFIAGAIHPATIKPSIKVPAKIAAQSIQLTYGVAQVAAIVSPRAAIIVSIVAGIPIIRIASPLGQCRSRQAKR
jgi:hypothetical protein